MSKAGGEEIEFGNPVFLFEDETKKTSSKDESSDWHPSKSVDVGFAIGIGFGFGQDGCELEELQAEYNRKVVLRITTHVLDLSPGELNYDSDIRKHMDLHKAAEISRLTQGAVSVRDVVRGPPLDCFTLLIHVL